MYNDSTGEEVWLVQCRHFSFSCLTDTWRYGLYQTHSSPAVSAHAGKLTQVLHSEKASFLKLLHVTHLQGERVLQPKASLLV